jgi:hypothetical protein
MLTAKKSLKQKNSEKNGTCGEGFFSICFASSLSPYKDALLTYYRKEPNKSVKAGHMRPGPRKSYHPRVEK